VNLIYKQFVILNPDNTLTWLDVVALLFVTTCRYIVKFDNKLNKQEAFKKCWAHSPLRAVLHCHSPGVATVARRLRIDVHNNNDDNNNNDKA